MNKKMNAELTKLYYDIQNPASFGSVRKLYEASGKKYTLNEIKHWLSAQDTYTLHRNRLKKFPRNVFFVSNIDDIWQLDIIDMRSVKKSNAGYSYILSVIDTFSKYGWAVPLYTKSGLEVTNAFKGILSQSNRVPLKANFDKGKEFLNKHFLDLLRTNNIKFYTTKNPDIKAAIVERYNKTIKTRITKYLTYRNTEKYIDILPMVIESYNNSLHSTTKFAPSHVNDKNVLEVWRNIYRNTDLVTNEKMTQFTVGDTVRISREKGHFAKGYESNFSDEIFKIIKIEKRIPVVYAISDMEGEIIDGTFYEKELVKVTIDKNSLFKIDKIISKKGKGASLLYLVRWKGYPSKFDSWVSAKDIVSL